MMDTLRISTADLPQADRVEAFREIFGKKILKIEVEPESHLGFTADMTLRSLPGLGIGAGTLSAMRNARPASLIEDDGLVLVVLLSGAATARQFGREHTVSDGQAIVTANDAPASFVSHAATKLINLRFERKRLVSRLLDPDACALKPLSRSNPALRLLTAYLELVGAGLPSASAPLTKMAVDHVYDLAALALGATREAAELAHVGGVRASRLAAALKFIRLNFDDPNLAPAAVADQVGISTRYLHKLLQETGASFSERVQDLRLARAFTLLARNGDTPQRVHDAAYSSGFNDLSHFNRLFRRKYGLTPTAARGHGEPTFD